MNDKIRTTPPDHGPWMAALIGAGFFIFLAAVQGLLFRVSPQSPHSAQDLPALLVKGRGLSQDSPSARRVRLADHLMRLRRAGAQVIVLEAWLDEASQEESSALLGELLEEAGKLKGKAGKQMLGRLGEMKARLDADQKLAEALAWCGNVVLPALVEEQGTASGVTRLSAAWDKGAYKVTRKGRGLQRLKKDWRVLRSPLKPLRDAALSMGAVAPASLVELPALHQVKQSWVNSLGLDALRAFYQMPPSGIKFYWKGDRLTSMELKARRLPLSPEATVFMSAPVAPQELDFSAAEDPRRLKGKVVFFQPWPETLSHAQGFESQRLLFSSLFLGDVDKAPPTGGDILFWCALALVSMACMVFAPWLFKPLGLALAILILWMDASRHATPLLRPTLSVLGLSLAGLGLALRKREAALREAAGRFKGATAPRHARVWQDLAARSGEAGVLAGCVMVRAGAQGLRAIEQSAEERGALVEDCGDGSFALLLSLEGNMNFPLEWLGRLRSRLPKASMALGLGQGILSESSLFGSIRWKLGGSAREKAGRLLQLAREGECLVEEDDYASWRDQLRIQLLSRDGRKVLNILSFT